MFKKGGSRTHDINHWTTGRRREHSGLHARFLCAWQRVQIPWGLIEHSGLESLYQKL
jgi:hypothetical protein